MKDADPLSKNKAWVDMAASALFLVLLAASIRQADLAAAEATRLHGHNVDSGAYLYLVVVLYFAPVAAMFLVASIATFRRLRIGRALHGFAIGLAVLPIVFVLLIAIWDWIAV